MERNRDYELASLQINVYEAVRDCLQPCLSRYRYASL